MGTEELLASYNAYKHSAPTAAPAVASSAAGTGGDAKETPDPAKTVTLPNGNRVVFTDNDDLRLIASGPGGTSEYAFHYHRKSAGGALVNLARRESQLDAGTSSLLGDGVEVRLRNQDGSLGPVVLDTGAGANMANMYQRAKEMVRPIKEAVELAPQFEKLRVVQHLKHSHMIGW